MRIMRISIDKFSDSDFMVPFLQQMTFSKANRTVKVNQTE